MATSVSRTVLSSSRSILTAPRCATGLRQLARRNLHTRKELPYSIEDGLGNFMSPRTLQMVGVEYQQGLLDRLNDYLRGKHRQVAAPRSEFMSPRYRGQTQNGRSARARHG